MTVELLTNESFHGSRRVLDLLSEAIGRLPMPKKRQHLLYILSCYVRPSAIEQAIDVIASQVRVTLVKILFDYSEVFTHGPKRLQGEFERIQESVRHRHGIVLGWKPIRPKSGALVHAKAYAVAEINSQRQVEAGCLFFGSANATYPGLGLALRSNVELGSVVTSRLALERFCLLFEELWEHETVPMDAALERDQTELLRFALLKSGCFLVKWSGNLKSQLSIRYKLTDKGKKAIAVTDKELAARGFEGDQSSLMKNYLRLPAVAARRDFPRAFSSNYTIESSLGRFCPQSIWNVVTKAHRREDKAFLNALARCLASEQLARATDAAKVDLKFLCDRGMVDCGPEHLAGWNERMVVLRESPEKLLRVRRMFSDFLLPYGREDVDKVKEVFDSIQETVRFSKRKNVAMRHFAAAVEAQNLDPLELGEEERAELRQLFKSQRARRPARKATRR